MTNTNNRTVSSSRFPSPEDVAAWSDQLSSLRELGYLNTAACVDALNKYYSDEQGLEAVVQHLGASSHDKAGWSEQLSTLRQLGYTDEAACVESLDKCFEDGGIDAVVKHLDNTDL